MTKYANFARVEGGGLQGNYLEIWTTECQMKVQSISAAVEAGEYQYCLQEITNFQHWVLTTVTPPSLPPFERNNLDVI